MPVKTSTQPHLTDREVNRFWSKVNKIPGQGPNGDCWRWKWKTRAPTTAVRDYPRFGVGSRGLNNVRIVRCNRLAFSLKTGVWPVYACHTCDVRDCCNPAHIFNGTHQDNMADMARKKRHVTHARPNWCNSGNSHWAKRHPERIQRGSARGGTKLREEQIPVIRRLHKQGTHNPEIAAIYGVSTTLIARILRGLNWSHVP